MSFRMSHDYLSSEENMENGRPREALWDKDNLLERMKRQFKSPSDDTFQGRLTAFVNEYRIKREELKTELFRFSIDEIARQAEVEKEASGGKRVVKLERNRGVKKDAKLLKRRLDKENSPSQPSTSDSLANRKPSSSGPNKKSEEVNPKYWESKTKYRL